MYSEIAKPLTDLTVKSRRNIVVWGQEQQCAFDNLKRKLCNAPVLFTFEVGKLWFLHTDASGVAVAAYVGQWDSGGNERPVAYASAKLTATQCAWSTIERERGLCCYLDFKEI